MMVSISMLFFNSSLITHNPNYLPYDASQGSAFQSGLHSALVSREIELMSKESRSVNSGLAYPG